MNIHFRFNSVKVVLAGIAGAIIVLLTLILIIISYNAAYNSVESAYLNQLKNVNDDVARQIEQFYEREEKNAIFLSRQRAMKELMKIGTPDTFATAMARVKEIHDIYGIYENVLISTPEKNPRIVAASLPQSVGVRWGGIGYDDVIENVLKGREWVSTPQKSPITGLAVIFVGAPIKDGDQVIGIMGLPVNLGILMHDMVKDIKIGDTGYPFATDINGNVFAHPDKEQIFKLNVKTYDFGKKMLESPSGTVVRYEWQGKDKILTFVKNEKRRFISSATIYVSDINKDARKMAVVMVIFGILGIALAGIGTYIFIAKRLKPLEVCQTVIQEMASGNLAMRYEGKISGDEIGNIAQSINTALDQFEKLISEVLVSAQNLVQAVDQIASGNQNLSQRTSEQASSLEEVASTIEEATAAIRQNADNSTEANKLADVTTKMAEEGNRVVVDAVSSINEINKSSKKIEEIISLINEISFQTNLLALNAAVEAARAGEQGRGFAVVAGEVRNLAQRSANAAKEIGSLIKESISKIDTGTDLANRSGDALREIVASMKNVARLISEIAAASHEQKQGIDQINIAVAEMDTMTQQNAALVEETAAASEEMALQAKDLRGMVERFTISRSGMSDTYAEKHKEVHLSAAGTGVKKPEAKTRTVKKAETASVERRREPFRKIEAADSKSIKEVLKDEGFEEF